MIRKDVRDRPGKLPGIVSPASSVPASRAHTVIKIEVDRGLG
jgi:hypothetical protein